MIDTVVVEVANPNHPYGVRGVGEVCIVPPMAAIANAIYDAIGVRLTSLPMNPGAVLEALWEKNGRRPIKSFFPRREGQTPKVPSPSTGEGQGGGEPYPNQVPRAKWQKSGSHRKCKTLPGAWNGSRSPVATVRQLVNNIDQQFPGLKALLYDDEEDDIMPGLAVIVDGEASQLGLLERVAETSEVHFLPAIWRRLNGPLPWFLRRNAATNSAQLRQVNRR